MPVIDAVLVTVPLTVWLIVPVLDSTGVLDWVLVTLPVSLGWALFDAVVLGVPVKLPEPVRVTVADDVSVAAGVPVLLGEVVAVLVMVDVTVEESDCVGALLAVPELVSVAVLLSDPVEEGLAPVESEAVCDGVAVHVLEAVLLGVKLGDGEFVGDSVEAEVALPVAVLLTDAVPVTDDEADGELLPVPLPVW